MSDKETAPWIKKVSAEILVGKDRCPICRWPLAESAEKGCVLGNCAYRPGDHRLEELRNLRECRARWVEVCQIIAEECTAQAPTHWQSMETAPRNGKEVLLQVEYRAGIPGKCLVGHWMRGGHCIEDHPPIDPGWYFWNGCAFDAASKPIAWMPIPEINKATPQGTPTLEYFEAMIVRCRCGADFKPQCPDCGEIQAATPQGTPTAQAPTQPDGELIGHTVYNSESQTVKFDKATPQGTPTDWEEQDTKQALDVMAKEGTISSIDKCPSCGCGMADRGWKDVVRALRCDNDEFHSETAPQGTPDKCPQCGSKDFWTVLPACHGGKAHKWHSERQEKRCAY